jgi:tripartite-type tricarboxylate transporter receptor subunit TctC
MSTLRIAIPFVTIGLMILVSGVATGQDYPARPIRLLTAQAGGGNDFVARLIATPLSANLGQPVVIENRGSLLSAEAVAKASPDGYTVLLTGSTFWISPLFRDVSYDPIRDYLPISQATSTPNLVVVHTSLPVKSVRELIALAKARPGELNYAGSSIGAPPHMAAELFKSMARVDIVLINFKGTGPALNSTVGGHVQVMFAPAGVVGLHVKAGRLRALAITSARPSALAPGLPTVAETVPGYEVVSIIGFLAPAKTPDSVIAVLSREIARVLQQPDIKERFAKSGAETVGGTPEQFGAAMKSEIAKWSKLIKDARLRTE